MWPAGDTFCCNDLQRSLTDIPNSTFAVQDTGIAYLSVGYVPTEDGRMGWFDQALRYCPFCGTELQTLQHIKEKAGN